MLTRFQALFRKLGKLDKLFLIVLVVAFIGNFVAGTSLWELFLTFAAVVLSVLVACRWLIIGVRRLIWRLRYRLVVAYLFIAFVPILLISSLVWMGSMILAGQIAAYVITSDLDRMTADLLMPARGLAWTPPEIRAQHARWLAPAFWSRYPGFAVLIRDDSAWRYPADAKIDAPPRGWGDASGLLRKDGVLYLWAHAIHDSTEVTMLVPMTEPLLAQLSQSLGELELRPPVVPIAVERLPAGGMANSNRVPPAENAVDLTVPYYTIVPIAVWGSPGKFENDALFIRTRYSAVLRIIFGQKAELVEGETTGSLVTTLFVVLSAVLIVVWLISIVIGVRLTRTITRAVHNLYQGTQRVRVGDFSHRIEVQGNDQLADLGQSFNLMTEDLERLVEVAKEKERLQSEIEIAREVQNQLFPKSVPVSNTIELAAGCLPARLVSGDYYDYMNLEPPTLAFAIGDVSGKGISAALLMATVQSTMRTQLRAGREMAVAAGNGGKQVPPSTAALVSRLNQQLFAFTPPEKFATFYFALYDDTTGLMTYTNAGHLPPILVRNGAASRLEVTGTVVGAFSFAQYEESSIRLERGDLLVCFTDGVTEPENEFGEMFGEDRLTELVVKHASRDSADIINAVTESVRQWTGSPELQDDMTLLLARRT